MVALLAVKPISMGEIRPSAGLYVHIPFCDAKCAYCDFVTFTDRHSQIDSYLSALSRELDRWRGQPIHTLFIGGGTPTVLSVAQINTLMSSIHDTLDARALSEATVEANPESTSTERLRAFHAGGVNRLSFGVQTTNDLLLKRLGRLHDSETFFKKFDMARTGGFDNINVDLMFGLPDQTLDDWRATLESVAALEPEHISAYALKIEPGTEFGREGLTVDSDLEADMYLVASEFLSAHGYEHYEISNFAKPGRESKHNLLYWENKDTIGVGLSSTSFFQGKRMKNVAHLRTYLEAISSGAPTVVDSSSLNADDHERESVMLALRLKRGVSIAQLERMRAPMTSTFLAQGLAVKEKGMYSLTPKGWLLSNLLFQQFV